MEENYYFNKKKNVKRIVSIFLASFLVIFLAVYGIYFNIEAEKKSRELEYQYQRTLNDMIDYVGYIEDYLFKATVASTPEMISNMLDGVTVCAHQAETCLAALPVEQHTVEKISEFLVQLGEISGVWSQHVLNNGKLTLDEYDSISQLCGYTSDLSGTVISLGENLAENSYTWAQLDGKVLRRLNDPFPDFSLMTYEGKYSEHDNDFKPAGLSGEILNLEDCRKKATSYLADILNVSENDISVKNHTENNRNNIETFCFEMSVQNNVFAYMDVTKQGGFIYSMIINRACKEVNLNEEQGLQAGNSFLNSIGLKNMKNVHYSLDDDCIVATYVYEENGILFYPDMVKVKISLDNGAPVGFESHKYLESHSDSRKFKSATLTPEEAKTELGSHLSIEDVCLVVNSTDYGAEYMAYEFKGRVSGIPVLVYIDAQTGAERDISILN